VRVLSTSVHGLEMPVDERHCIARGACPFLCLWSAWCFVYCTSAMYNKSVLQYCIGTKKRRPPRTAVEIPFNIKGLVSASTLIAKNQDESFDTNILKLEIYTLQM
jgi:hypothetical protein